MNRTKIMKIEEGGKDEDYTSFKKFTVEITVNESKEKLDLLDRGEMTKAIADGVFDYTHTTFAPDEITKQHKLTKSNLCMLHNFLGQYMSSVNKGRRTTGFSLQKRIAKEIEGENTFECTIFENGKFII